MAWVTGSEDCGLKSAVRRLAVPSAATLGR
jgi:hypothetical protein